MQDQESTAERGLRRYEAVRKLNPQQFAALYRKNIETGTPFDDLVDELTAADQKPAHHIQIQHLSDPSPEVIQQVRQMYAPESPTFDSAGDPTDETLAAIENWQTNFDLGGDPWAKFIEFCREAWNMDYGTIREEQDEDGKTLLCFVTGGWSANEAVAGAMYRNFMFRAMRWHSSYRGGLVKYAAR